MRSAAGCFLALLLRVVHAVVDPTMDPPGPLGVPRDDGGLATINSTPEFHDVLGDHNRDVSLQDPLNTHTH